MCCWLDLFNCGNLRLNYIKIFELIESKSQSSIRKTQIQLFLFAWSIRIRNPSTYFVENVQLIKMKLNNLLEGGFSLFEIEKGTI